MFVLVSVLRVVFFFFSSRRRHTRCSRDWSSDVCSSDLDFFQRLTEPQSGFQIRSQQMEANANRTVAARRDRSEEHTSELQSRLHLVCRLLLEKKKRKEEHNT